MKILSDGAISTETYKEFFIHYNKDNKIEAIEFHKFDIPLGRELTLMDNRGEKYFIDTDTEKELVL